MVTAVCRPDWCVFTKCSSGLIYNAAVEKNNLSERCEGGINNKSVFSFEGVTREDYVLLVLEQQGGGDLGPTVVI